MAAVVVLIMILVMIILALLAFVQGRVASRRYEQLKKDQLGERIEVAESRSSDSRCEPARQTRDS